MHGKGFIYIYIYTTRMASSAGRHALENRSKQEVAAAAYWVSFSNVAENIDIYIHTYRERERTQKKKEGNAHSLCMSSNPKYSIAIYKY